MTTHSQIASPPPFSMIDVLAGSVYKYTGQSQDDNFDVLIEDAIALTKTHMNPWGIEVTPEDIKRKIHFHSFWELFTVLNELYTESENKQHWFSKEPGLFKHIYELAMHLPEAKFIYMVRDPRDVVASMLKGGIHEQNVYNAAQKWRNEQRLCLNANSDPLLSKQMLLVSYEALLEDVDATVRRVMNFLEIPFEKTQLEFYKNEKVIVHSKKSEFWKNLSKPIDQKNKGRYSNSLTKQQIKVIESLCWKEMKVLGYQPVTAKPENISVFSKIWYRGHSHLKKLGQSVALTSESRRQKKRRRRNSTIKNRSFER